MEAEKELLEELLRYVQRQYMQIVEIGNLTQELKEMFARDDRESVKMLLELRQKEMEKADEIKSDIRAILDAVSQEQQEHLRELLDGRDEKKADYATFEEEKIKELSCQIRRSLERTIQIDQRLSSRLAGEDSYYKKGQL